MAKAIQLVLLFSVLLLQPVLADSPLLENGQLRFRLNEEGSHYIRMTVLGQVWLRYTQVNPGSTVYDQSVSDVYDIGIRRFRLSWYGQLTDKVFFYTQFGQNNFSYLSQKYRGAFFHDALAEYRAFDKSLSIGAGLTGWSGLSRYASPSIGSILTLDAPLYQQTTNSISDQFLRKLSVYAKGKLGKLDYRLALTNPMVVQQATVNLNDISEIAEFSTGVPKLQFQGYMAWQFLEEEGNLTPYTKGTYLGAKRVFNIGAGFIYQPEAMWYLSNVGDTLTTAMQHFALDLFYDAPLNTEKGNALTIYASYHNLDFGPNYLRNIGVMNPANGINANGTFNGAGDAFPMIGTGTVLYSQLGYKFKDDLLPNNGSLQPYIAVQYGQYKRLKDDMLMFEGGINWLIHGRHGGKITLNFQNRPIFKYDNSGDLTESQRNGMLQLQYQVSL